MKKPVFYISILLLAVIISCKKGPGEGGRASIKGKVYSINYNANMTVPQDSGYLGGQKVYIIYGEETAIGKNQDTNHEGAFEFNYLRKGKYKVYVYTKRAPNLIDSAIVQIVEIKDKKEAVNLPDFKIKTTKN